MYGVYGAGLPLMKQRNIETFGVLGIQFSGCMVHSIYIQSEATIG